MWNNNSNTGTPWVGQNSGVPNQAQNSQWSLNPQHYANVHHSQVDWAALAQQWILMKGASGSDNKPGDAPMQTQSLPPTSVAMQHFPNFDHPPPPPPPPGPIPSPQQQIFRPGFPLMHQHPPPIRHGGHGHPPVPPMPGPREMNLPSSGDIIGEAPMEVEPLDNQSQNFGTETVEWTSSSHENSWLAPETNNPWETAQQQPDYSFHPPNFSRGGGGGFRPMLRNRRPAPPDFSNFQNYQPVVADAQVVDNSKDRYWGADAGAPEALQQSYGLSRSAYPEEYEPDAVPIPEFDAAKRKALPAWIREGLEKMERERKKKEETAKLEEQREEMRKRRAEEQAAAILSGDAEKINSSSKWAAESDPHLNGSDAENHSDDDVEEESKPESIFKILKTLPVEIREQAIMFAVRRVSTSILLSVTNASIQEVVSEVVQRHRAKSRKKVSTLQIKKTSALASISGGLGLAAYGSDSEGSEPDSKSRKSESEESSEGSDSEDSDSEVEIKRELEKKRRTWELSLAKDKVESDNPTHLVADQDAYVSKQNDVEKENPKINGSDTKEVAKPFANANNDADSKADSQKSAEVCLKNSAGLKSSRSRSRSRSVEKPPRRKNSTDKPDSSKKYKRDSKVRRDSRSKSRSNSRSRDSNRRGRSRSRSKTKETKSDVKSKENKSAKDISGCGDLKESKRERKESQRRSRSRSKTRTRKRSRSTSRRRHSRSRNNRRSRSRSTDRKRSQVKSKSSRRKQSRSKSRGRYSSSSSSDRSRGSRSRSRSRNRRRSRSRSRGGKRKSDRKRSLSKSRRRSKSRSPRMKSRQRSSSSERNYKRQSYSEEGKKSQRREKSRSNSSERKHKSKTKKRSKGSPSKTSSSVDKKHKPSKKRTSRSRSRSKSSEHVSKSKKLKKRKSRSSSSSSSSSAMSSKKKK